MSSSSGSDRSGGRLDERAIDRKLLAQLIARHGEPPRARPRSPEEIERRDLVARRDRALAAADPSLIGHLERHERSSDELGGVARAAAGVEIGLCLQRTVCRKPDSGASGGTPVGSRAGGPDQGAIRVRELGEVREIEVPEDLFDAMENRTPQAFLRDLHRPVQHFGDVTLRRRSIATAAGSLAQIRAAVDGAMSRRTGAAAAIRLASREARAGMAELRELLARPWEDSRPENPLPLPRQAPSAEDMMWFGMSGGYDPDQ